MPKFSKGHNSDKNKVNLKKKKKKKSGNLLIIPYQLTKFQAPSSIGFRYIADKLKRPKLLKGHYSGKIRWIF